MPAVSQGEHDAVFVVPSCSGADTNQIVQALDTAHLANVLRPLPATDAVPCIDGFSALAAAAHHLGIKHRALNFSAGQPAISPWHVNNVNGC